MVKTVIVFVDVNGKKLDRGSEERDRELPKDSRSKCSTAALRSSRSNRWRTQEILGTCRF